MTVSVDLCIGLLLLILFPCVISLVFYYNLSDERLERNQILIGDAIWDSLNGRPVSNDALYSDH